MICLLLRQWCARTAWLAVALGIQSLSAVEAAPPVTVGVPAFLDRVGPSGGLAMAVAGNGQGLVAMVWAASPTVLQARVYDAFGPPRTPVFEVTREVEELSIAYLAVDGSGGFLVAWVRGANPTVDLTTLVARRYGWDGSPATPEVVCGTGFLLSASLYRSFAFSLAADGSFLAAFQKPASPGSGASLVVRAFGAGGQPQGLEKSVSTAPELSFVNVVLGRHEQDVVVAFGKSGDGGITTEVWARRLDSLGTPRSAEIAAVPAIPFYGHAPSGVALYPGGRFAVGYQVCDALTMDFTCVSAGIQWIGSDDSLLPDSDGADPIFHAHTQSWLVQDPQGNPFTFTANDGVGNFRAANPLGAVVSKASVSSSLPPPPFPGATVVFTGLVPLGPATVGLVWYTYDWTYLQTITVASERTAAPSFHTIAPCRLIDTRQGGAALRAGEDRAIQASGLCSIPVGARTLAANVLSVGSTDAGDLRSYRADRLVPPTSVLNYGAGQVRASQTFIPLSDDGALALRATQGKGTTHLIIDVSGYFQ